MMSAKEALINLSKLSVKMSGLSIQECRIFDASLQAIDSYLESQEKDKSNVTKIKPDQPQ